MSQGRSPRDNWRHQTGSPARGSSSATSGSSKRRRFLLLLIPCLIALGTVFAFPFFIRPKPEPLFLSLCVAEYDAPEGWPINAWAQQDGEALKQHFPNGTLAFQSQEGEGMLREIDQLAERAAKNRNQPAVVHLCALASASDEEVFLLPAKVTPGMPGIPLARVLESVGKIGGHRLLILDLRPVAEPRLGQLGDELTRTLHAQLKRAEEKGDLPYFVFAQSVPAEYPYVSPELRHGVLGEFLHRGLLGYADGWSESKEKDRQVSALEVVRYTRARTAHWLLKHEAMPQVPVLYGQSDDFVLLSLAKENVPVDEVIAADEGLKLETWELLDRWKREGAIHRVPRTERQLEETIRTAERRLQGGVPRELVERDLGRLIPKLEEQRKALALKPFPIVRRNKEPKPGPKEPDLTKLAALLAQIQNLPKAKGEEFRAKLAPLWETPPEAAPYDAVVGAVMKAIVEGKDPSLEQLKLYLELLKGFKPPAEGNEVALLSFFAGEGLKYRDIWPAGTIRAVLRAALAAEELTSLDGRAQRIVIEDLGQADQDFRQAMLSLFEPNELLWGESVAKLTALPDRYKVLAQRSSEYAKAMAEWEEVTNLLPSAAETVWLDSLGRGEKAWTDLVVKVRLLQEAIAGKADSATLSRATEGMVIQRGQWLELAREVPSSPVELRRRLNWLLWSAKERQDLTAKANEAALKKAREVLAEEVSASGDIRQKPDTDEAKLAAQRATRANELVKLAGGQSVAPGGWRQALAEQWVERYGKAKTPQERESFAWLIHPNDLPAIPETASGARNDPAPEVRKQAEQAWARWLANQRWRPLAEALQTQTAPAAKAYATELTETVRKLATWIP
jgi:hypothetical protein